LDELAYSFSNWLILFSIQANPIEIEEICSLPLCAEPPSSLCTSTHLRRRACISVQITTVSDHQKLPLHHLVLRPGRGRCQLAPPACNLIGWVLLSPISLCDARSSAKPWINYILLHHRFTALNRKLNSDELNCTEAGEGNRGGELGRDGAVGETVKDSGVLS
jgi:hypothetical protein